MKLFNKFYEARGDLAVPRGDKKTSGLCPGISVNLSDQEFLNVISTVRSVHPDFR